MRMKKKKNEMFILIPHFFSYQTCSKEKINKKKKLIVYYFTIRKTK